MFTASDAGLTLISGSIPPSEPDVGQEIALNVQRTVHAGGADVDPATQTRTVAVLIEGNHRTVPPGCRIAGSADKGDIMPGMRIRLTR